MVVTQEVDNRSFYSYCKQLFKNDRNLQESTRIMRVQVIERHLKDYFSKVPYDELNATILNDFTENHLKGNIFGVKVVITRALTELYRSEVLEKDLRPLVRYPKMNHKEKRKPLSKHEVQQVYDYMRGHRLEHTVHLMFKTGVRTGELLALTWEDIELLEDNLIVVHVNKSIGLSEIGFTVKDTKNKQSVREVYAYDEPLWKLLETARANSKTKWVNPNKSNTTHANQMTISRLLRKAGEYIGLPDILNPHRTRHTYISTCLHNGIKPEYIAPQVGHKDTLMIYKVYGRATEDIKNVFKNMSNF